jgi:hypothetical protein
MTPARSIPARIRLAGAVSAAAFAVVALSGCSLLAEFTSHQKEQVFATWADAPRADPDNAEGTGRLPTNTPSLRPSTSDRAFVPPSFVPQDATNLRIRIVTDGPGDIVRFESPTPIVSDSCVEGPLSGSALLETTWWPATTPQTGIVCDAGWQVFTKDGVTYGWTSV